MKDIMKHKDKTIIDLGPTLLTLVSESGDHRADLLLFTAFVNGISLRSNTRHIPTVRDRFIACIWLMSGYDLCGGGLVDVSRQIREWVNERVIDMEGNSQ